MRKKPVAERGKRGYNKNIKITLKVVYGMPGHIYSRTEIISAILPLVKKYGAERAILFGSYARQSADAASDIDLVIVGGENFDPTDTFCIAEELYRMLGKKVDVFELREINTDSPFYDAILEEGVQIA